MRAALCLSAVLALGVAAPSVPHVALDAKVVDAQEAVINHVNSVQSVGAHGGRVSGHIACGVPEGWGTESSSVAREALEQLLPAGREPTGRGNRQAD